MNVQNVASVYQRVLAYFSLEVVEKQLIISIKIDLEMHGITEWY